MTSLASLALAGKEMPLDLAHLHAPSPAKKLQRRNYSISLDDWHYNTCLWDERKNKKIGSQILIMDERMKWNIK